jgi:hypothetical protein
VNKCGPYSILSLQEQCGFRVSLHFRKASSLLRHTQPFRILPLSALALNYGPQTKNRLSAVAFVDMTFNTSNQLKTYLNSFWDYFQSNPSLQKVLETTQNVLSN